MVLRILLFIDSHHINVEQTNINTLISFTDFMLYYWLRLTEETEFPNIKTKQVVVWIWLEYLAIVLIYSWKITYETTRIKKALRWDLKLRWA